MKKFSWEDDVIVAYDREEYLKEAYEANTAYAVGDRIQITGDTSGDYYRVIAASGTNQDYVVALKENPLTATEITSAGGTVGYRYSDTNQTGGMAYGSDSTYTTSNVKSVVNAWAQAKFTDELKTVDGYSARLINLNEVTNLGYEWVDNGSVAFWQKTDATPSWVYNSSYFYWTMSQYNDSAYYVWLVNNNGRVSNYDVNTSNGAVRPVINVYKSAIQSS